VSEETSQESKAAGSTSPSSSSLVTKEAKRQKRETSEQNSSVEITSENLLPSVPLTSLLKKEELSEKKLNQERHNNEDAVEAARQRYLSRKSKRVDQNLN